MKKILILLAVSVTVFSCSKRTLNFQVQRAIITKKGFVPIEVAKPLPIKIGDTVNLVTRKK